MTDIEVDELLMRARKGGAAPALIAKAQAMVKRDRELVFHRTEGGRYEVGRAPNVFVFECKWDLPVQLMHQAVTTPNRYIDASALFSGPKKPLLTLWPEHVRRILERRLDKLERSSGELAMALRGGRIKRRLDHENRKIMIGYFPDDRSPLISTSGI